MRAVGSVSVVRRVMTPPSLRRVASADPASPAAHHVASGGFCNPWPSFRFSAGFRKFAKLMLGADWKRATPPPPAELVKVVAPDWARISADKPATMLLTWMGHAAMLLSLPSGQRILFDPCWSDRCSPVQFAGPRRYTPPPCPLADLPPIDAVVISHNHYDHLDLNTIKDLAARNPDAIFFAPLGNAAWFRSVAVPNAVECDWWDEYEVGGSGLHIACTPCQHFTGRSLTDRFQTLWSSWVVTCGASKFYFAGDTGYRTVLEDEDEDAVPTCPVFKQIGERYGPFDLAAIPIGAYSPRWFMSSVHCNPRDAVDLHVDVRSRRSVGMHWGTFVLTDEPVMEPPALLKAELARRGLDPDAFVTVNIGETVTPPPPS